MSKHTKRSANEPSLSDSADDNGQNLSSRHMRFGWWSLLVFLGLGFLLEALWGFRIQWFVADETRRTMWRLAHAHGTLISLMHVVFGVTLAATGLAGPRIRRVASPCLIGASFTLPIGFFLGGLFTYSTEPGLGVLLVPVGGLLLLIAIYLMASAFSGQENDVADANEPANSPKTQRQDQQAAKKNAARKSKREE